MVTRLFHVKDRQGACRQSGSLMIELMVAITLLGVALFPIAYSITSERQYARAAYQRAVAMEIVDGEIEILAAGEWHSYTNGTQPYQVHALAAANLPPGQYLLTLEPGKARLEWRPSLKLHGGAVVREVRLQ